jgi:hypothetical protein
LAAILFFLVAPGLTQLSYGCEKLPSHDFEPSLAPGSSRALHGAAWAGRQAVLASLRPAAPS